MNTENLFLVAVAIVIISLIAGVTWGTLAWQPYGAKIQSDCIQAGGIYGTYGCQWSKQDAKP